MRDFGKVAPSFWTGDTGRQLRAMGRDEQVLALFLITAPCSNMIGLYHLPLAVIVHYLGWDEKGVRQALQRIAEVGFCQYDYVREIVLVPKMAEHQIGTSLNVRDKRVRSVHRTWEAFRKTPFYRLFHQRYQAAYHLPALTESTESEQLPLPGLIGDDQPAKPPPRTRTRDDLFDAIAEITSADPQSSGAYIGKVASSLRKAEPPYTPAEVRALPAAIRAAGLDFTVTLGSVEKYIGWTRKKPQTAGGRHGELGSGHRLQSPEGKYAGVGTVIDTAAKAAKATESVLASE